MALSLVAVLVVVMVGITEGFATVGMRHTPIRSALSPRMSISGNELNRLLAYRKVAPSIADGSPTALYGSTTLSSSAPEKKETLGKLPLPTAKELKKLLPLGSMLFCILFNYTILRDTKVGLGFGFGSEGR